MDKNTDAAKLKERYEPKQVEEVALDRQVHRVRFSPDGQFLLAGGYDALVRRWEFDGEEFEQRASVTGHHGWVQTFAFHPRGETVFTADTWGALQCWPYADETPRPNWRNAVAHDGWIRSLDVSRDGRLVATGGKDRAVRVWSASDGKLVHAFEGHREEVTCVAFHPDGQALVSGGFDGTVKQWNLETGKHVRDIDATSLFHHERIQDVCGLRIVQFHDDGRTLLCAGSEPIRGGRTHGIPTIHLYDWKSGEIAKSLKQGETKDGYVFDIAWHPDGFFMFVTCGTPGQGKLQFRRIEDEKPFWVNGTMSNCHSLAVHPNGRHLLVAATNRRSQGNGAVLDKEGNYKGNFSPLHLFEFPQPAA